MPYACQSSGSTIGIGRLFIFGHKPGRRMAQTLVTTAELALHYRGIGGRATNKQGAKSKTFAQLASVISNLKRHNAFDQHGCLSQYRRALCPIYRCNCSRNVMASFTVEKVLHCLHSHWFLSSVSSSPGRPSERRLTSIFSACSTAMG